MAKIRKRITLFSIFILLTLSTIAFAGKSHFIWTSFSAGELSPLLDGQINFDKYYAGAKTLENFIPRSQGPVSNRPGFKYIAGTKTNTAKSRLVPFIFSDEQAYVLEFGNQYIRFFRDGGQIQSVDTDVGLLIHANEADATAGTSILDSSPSVHTLTAVGNAQTDEDKKKFGNASLLLDGTGDYITIPDNTDFTITDEDYAIDAWVYPIKGVDIPYTIYSQRTDANNWVKFYLDSYTSLLLHMDGTDGSTTFTDDGPKTHTVTPVGTAQLDTAQSKFGTASGLFDGNSDYLVISDHADFDFSGGVWAVDMWVRLNSLGTLHYLFDQASDASNYMQGTITTANKVRFNVVSGGSGVIDLTSTGTLSVNTWHHVAVVENSNDYHIFIDGNLDTTSVDADRLANYTGNVQLFASQIFSFYLDGWADEVRISKNIARWTTSFTVATSAYDEEMLYPALDLRIAGSTETRTSDSAHGESISYDEWGHVQLDADGTLHYLFANGVLQNGSGTNLSNTPVDFTQNVHIGGHHNNSAVVDTFNGWIDELRMYQIGEHTSDFTPNTSEYGTTGSSPLELTTNVDYLEKDLFELQFAQSADTLYIAHGDYPPKKLIRVSDTVWKLDDIDFFPFPFQTQNENPSAGLTLADKTVGDSALPRTFTASAAIFKSGDVGRIIREEIGYGSGEALVKTFTDTTHVDCDIYKEFSSTGINSGEWELIGNSSTATLTFPSAILAFGDVITVTASQNVFESTDVDNYISVEGTEGTVDVTALLKIISYTSATVVNGVVMRRGDLQGIPETQRGIKEGRGIFNVIFTSAIISAGNWFISDPMWDSTLGYPKSLTFFENRLLWSGTLSFPQTIWGSEVDSYESHLGGTNDSDAYRFTLAGRQVNEIKWIDASDVLLVGTNGAEWVLGSRGADEPTTSTNVIARSQTGHGSSSVQPVNIGQSILYLQKGSEKVREMTYDFDIDRYDSPDLTLIAEHITDGGIVEMDYQEDPTNTGWFVRADGTLLSMTLLREQEVIGWGRHETDGSFESIAVIPGDNGDELWTIVNRTIGGATKRYVELMQPIFEDTTLDSDEAFFVDSGLTYNGVSTSTLTGLDHIEGETVSVLANGVVFDDAVVSSGGITLKLATVTTEATRAAVGLPYTSTLQTMRIEQKDALGTAQGRTKRINRVTFRLDSSKYFKYGSTPTGTLKTKTLDSLSSGDTKVDFVMGNNKEGYVTILNDKPLPLTVVAIIPEVNVQK